MAAAMEVDQGAPLAPEVELRLALTQENYKRALELVEHVDLEIHSFSGGAAERGDPAVFAPVQMVLYLIARDLNNARHLWRRSPDKLKEPQSMLRALWTVGQHLWQRDVPQAYTALQVQWSPDLQPLIKKLKERIQQDELELIQRAFRRIKVATLAEGIGMETAAAIAVAKAQGWKVDENEGVVEPVAKPIPPRETLGLSHLDKLTTYVSFLEQKNVTTKG